jgi:predicted RNA-binding Zn-ribbon protein involved in translation (DUF1610 family)
MADHGGVLIKVSKTYPSSQRCGCCGKINLEARDLSVRRWTCPDCGEEHVRDINTEEAPLHHLHPVLKKNTQQAPCNLHFANGHNKCLGSKLRDILYTTNMVL